MKSWSRKKLTDLLYQGFIGTIADNIIEIGWVLCFSLLANKLLVETITTMFGLNDAFWVVLSSTYYTTRTSLTAILPKAIKEHGLQEESKQFKNHIYLFYLMLLPLGVLSFIFMSPLLTLLGVQKSDLPLYATYFRLTVLSILVAAPWSVMIPAYLRTRGRGKIASILDHCVAWGMLIGIFVTTHAFQQGVLWAMAVNILANAIPLFWFIWKQPIPHFWKTGFEFSWSTIKNAWIIVKWELVRRLSPRISSLIGASFIITVNPLYLASKYWIDNLAMLPEGWVDSLAGTLNSHVSQNVGIKNTTDSSIVPHKDNRYLFKKSVVGVVITVVVVYLIAIFGLRFLPASIYTSIINPWIYVCLTIGCVTRLRYYMWLSISRSYRHDLNKIAQLCYAIPTIVGTPFLLWLFLHRFQFGLIGIMSISAIISTIQWITTEYYFKKKGF